MLKFFPSIHSPSPGSPLPEIGIVNMICQLCHCTLPGHKCGFAAHQSLWANVTVDTLGKCSKGTTDLIWQCYSQGGTDSHSPQSLICVTPSSFAPCSYASYASGSWFCLPDWKNKINSLFFFFFLVTFLPVSRLAQGSVWSESVLEHGKQ